MTNIAPNNTIQRIITSWSSTLELDQDSGESIVTEQDLDRVILVLSRFSKDPGPIDGDEAQRDSTNPSQHHSVMP